MAKNGIDATIASWYLPSDAPDQNGVYLVVNFAGEISYRIFEDNAWWYFTYCEGDHQGDDGGWELVPNDSFAYWAFVRRPAVAEMKAEGHA